MSQRGSVSRVDLAEVITLVAAIERDDTRSAAERTEIDQPIARALPSSADRTQTIRTWLDGVRATDPEVRTLHGKVAHAHQTAQLAMVLLGGILGIGATLGAFYYDGAGRVNVVTVLASLVLLPALLLLPFGWTALPDRARHWLPAGDLLTRLFEAFNLARLSRLAFRVLPATWRDPLEGALAHGHTQRAVYGGLPRWLLLRASQSMALAFQFSGLLTAFALIVFSDLVFGWSTTLSSGDALSDARTVHRITEILAAPWQAFWPAAAPDLELIRDSRYYRAVDAPLASEEAARLGQWWPFVLLCMTLYGLVPRIATSVLTQLALRRAIRRAFALVPGQATIVSRLHRQRISTTNNPARPSDADPTPVDGREDAMPSTGEPVDTLIHWAGVPTPEDWTHPRFPGARAFQAGGDTSLAADQAVLAEIKSLSQRSGAVLLVKAWEPPLLELLDFLRDLRPALGAGVPIAVVPVALDDDGVPTRAEDSVMKVWIHKLRTLGDPWVAVQPPEAHP